MKTKIFKTQILSESVASFFKECQNDLIYYTPEYLSFLEDLIPNIDVCYYCLSNLDHKIFALMPIAKKTIGGKGTIVNSLPFYGSHGGVLFLNDNQDKAKIQKLIIEEILNDIQDENILSITIVENPFQPFDASEMNLLGFEVIDNRLGQFKNIKLELYNQNFDYDLLMSFHSKTRNVVRKGLTFNAEFSEQIDDNTIDWLQSVHEKSILKLNGKFKTKEVFKTLLEHFPSPKNSRLFICKIDNKNIAGVLVLVFNETVEYFTPVIEEEYKSTQLLSSLIYETMKTLSKEGYKLWNWGGTWESQEGVYRFKDRFGGYTIPYRYFSLIKNQSIKEIDKDILASDFNFFYSYKFNS